MSRSEIDYQVNQYIIHVLFGTLCYLVTLFTCSKWCVGFCQSIQQWVGGVLAGCWSFGLYVLFSNGG